MKNKRPPLLGSSIILVTLVFEFVINHDANSAHLSARHEQSGVSTIQVAYRPMQTAIPNSSPKR